MYLYTKKSYSFVPLSLIQSLGSPLSSSFWARLQPEPLSWHPSVSFVLILVAASVFGKQKVTIQFMIILLKTQSLK